MVKKNIWKSLLISLMATNFVMIVIWTIMSAFGQQPYYLMSFVIHNVVALLWWIMELIA